MRPVPCEVTEPGGQGAQGKDCVGLRVRTEQGNQDQRVRMSLEPHHLLNKDSECREGVMSMVVLGCFQKPEFKAFGCGLVTVTSPSAAVCTEAA